MKKSLSILITLVLISILGQAQTNVYHQFPDSNCHWKGLNYSRNGTMTVTYDQYSLVISGDTTIGSFVYHKLYQNGYTYDHPTPTNPGYPYDKFYKGAFRQDIPNRKVYLFNGGQDLLAYDFNLKVGDTLKSCLGVARIKSIDSVLVGNKYHKAFTFDTGGPPYYKFIEGIGSTHGFLQEFFPFEGGSDLQCVSIEAKTVWPSPSPYTCGLVALSIPNNFIKTNKVVISQNPFSNETTLTFNTVLNKMNLIIYNSTGQLVKQVKNISGKSYILNRDHLESGIYFLRILENNDIIATEKFIITDN